ncbi:MAG TPA: HIRAN domain-containing protein [Gaiellaceae bacterium]|nr:HIRAN domain-containing protein [Gaiellaceae bacterium]
MKLAGASYRLDALQDDGFAPGRRLALVPEPENEHDPNAVAVWDAGRRVQAGYVPAEVAPELRGDEQAVSLWEFRDEDGRRVGLRVLVAPADAWIQEPRP